MNKRQTGNPGALLSAALIIFLAMLLFSCGNGVESENRDKTVPALETVRLLAEENSKYENRASRSTAAHAPEIKAILDRGYIVFAMTAMDQKPFYYREENSGTLIGIDAELAYAVANRMEVKAVFNRSAASFDDVVTKVANREADIGLSKLSVTTHRAEIVSFSSPYIVFRQALLINRLEYAKLGSENKLPGFIRNYRGALGVIGNSAYEDYARTNFPNASLVTYKSWGDAVDALFRGELLAIYRDEEEIHIVNTTRKDAAIMMKPVFLGDKRDSIAMAVSAEAPQLRDWLNIFLDDYLLRNRHEMTPGRLIERHFGNH